MPRDNIGVVFGSKATLVIDAGITPSVGRIIQGKVRELTDRAIHFLVNTTYHGDHTFGNAAFAPDVHIVSSHLNAVSMVDLEKEKRTRSRNMYGDRALEEVTEWRKPDLIFEHFMAIDLGGGTVQLWQFGPGNGPGDTIVYVPSARAAWTGNFLGHRGVAPMLLDGAPRPYIGSLMRMKDTLDELTTIIPGHGPIDHGAAPIDWLVAYLENLDAEVRAGYLAGLPLEDVLAKRQAPSPPPIAGMPAEARAGLQRLNRAMDRLNVLATYRECEHAGTDRRTFDRELGVRCGEDRCLM